MYFLIGCAVIVLGIAAIFLLHKIISKYFGSNTASLVLLSIVSIVSFIYAIRNFLKKSILAGVITLIYSLVHIFMCIVYLTNVIDLTNWNYYNIYFSTILF